jgi:quercetin dioxygenase-like cupin family protein
MVWRLSLVAIVMGAFVWLGAVKADLDPKARSIVNPSDLKWTKSQSGNEAWSIISGDPKEEGSLYVLLDKWVPNHITRPHFHPHDRFITVLSGTWWVGTGADCDGNTVTPVKPGTLVVDHANQIHCDGTKDGEVMLEIVGMGTDKATNVGGK